MSHAEPQGTSAPEDSRLAKAGAATAPWRWASKRWAPALVFALLLLVGVGAWLSWTSANDGVKHAPQAQRISPRSLAGIGGDMQDPEAWLLDIHEAALAGQHQQALGKAEQLAAQFPNFQLAQLLYAELLNLSLDQPFEPESLDLAREQPKQGRNRMNALLDELRQRRTSLTPAAQAGWLPRNFVQLPDAEPYALAVDVSRSRLYLFGNQARLGGAAPANGASGWVLLADSYVSAGLYGVGKQVEGDAKTPEGVYFVGNKPPNRSLPDLYGVGALTLNYPNALDKLRGKTGSGIWLHGTPQSEYSRPPLASDGCVVLSNSDMKRLQALPVKGAPIVIANRLDWVAPGSITQDRREFRAVLGRWHAAWQGGQETALKLFYSESFRRNGEGLATWWPQLLKHAKGQAPSLDAQLKSILRWSDAGGDHMIVTLQETSGPGLWRLYWLKEGADWKIVFEGPVSPVPTDS